MILQKSDDEITQILAGLQLSTARTVLRHIQSGDAADVYAYASDARVARYLTWHPHESLAATQAFIDTKMSKDMTVFGIELEGKVIGSFDLRLVPAHNKASFGYALNRAYWGRGIMPEVLARMMQYAFEELGLTRMESTYYAGNDASGRVMEKCGFTREGFCEQELFIKGAYVDVYHLGITRAGYASFATASSTVGTKQTVEPLLLS